MLQTGSNEVLRSHGALSIRLLEVTPVPSDAKCSLTWYKLFYLAVTSFQMTEQFLQSSKGLMLVKKECCMKGNNAQCPLALVGFMLPVNKMHLPPHTHTHRNTSLTLGSRCV